MVTFEMRQQAKDLVEKINVDSPGPHTSGSSVIHSLLLSPVLPEDVALQINLLNPSKTNDTYDLPVSSLKISKHVIA